MRVVTLTLNPAIDQTILLDRLIPGEVHRAQGVRRDAGGKGVNVASCLADWGVAVTALGLLGADNAAPFEALFRAKGIEDGFARIAGATRINLKIVDGAGTTDINLDGPQVDATSIAAVIDAAETMAGPESLVILAGSLPPGCPSDSYATIVARLQAKGARILLDSSGDALTHALGADVLPDMLKPNKRELADWCGEALDSAADVARVAGRLHARGVALVTISMGEDGALFLSREGAILARLPAPSVESTVGAGDAMVGGIAAAMVEDAGLERTARLATAFAVAKLGRAGPHLPDRAAVEALAAAVSIETVERNGAALTGESA